MNKVVLNIPFYYMYVLQHVNRQDKFCLFGFLKETLAYHYVQKCQIINFSQEYCSATKPTGIWK